MLSPRQTFEENIRPAELLLRVFCLLENDEILTQGELVDALRNVVAAASEEDVMVVYNEIFLGMVREAAQMPLSSLRKATLCHLLRQAIVVACTALETFLPALLRSNLPTVIAAVGRDFVPVTDGTVRSYFRELRFSLEDTLRLMADANAALYISDRILNLASFRYLSSKDGVHVTGRLLGIENPWDRIAQHLDRDKNDLVDVLKRTIDRRNDIVHRGDRDQEDPAAMPREISYAWTKQSVDGIHHICLALDEIVAERMEEYRAASQSEQQWQESQGLFIGQPGDG